MSAMVDESLLHAIRPGGNKKIFMLFEEWRTLYGQVADLSKEQLKDINGTLRFSYAGDPDDDVPARLFVIHTFDSLLSKLLAAEILRRPRSHIWNNTFAEDLATIEGELPLIDLRLRADIEEGGFFRATGILGFVEEAIFSWYLDGPAATVMTVQRSPRLFAMCWQSYHFTALISSTAPEMCSAIFIKISCQKPCARVSANFIHPIGSLN